MARRLIYLDGDNKVVGTLEVQHGRVIATGKAVGVDEMTVVEPDTLERVLPHQGDRWLDAVRYMYRSPYLGAMWEEDAIAEGFIAKNGTPAQKADVSKDLPPLLTPHKPQDRDLVEHATGLIRARWLQDAGQLIEPREWLDELSTKDVDSIVEQVADRWSTVYQACHAELITIVNEAVQRGMLQLPESLDSISHLRALGAEWLDAFGKTMIRRWVGDKIHRAISASDTLEAQSLAVVQAVEQVPDAFSIVLQPLIRRLLAFGTVMQEVERNEPYTTVRKARERQQYVVITAQDSNVCKVCEYISEIGPFWLKDALDLFDNFIEAVEADEFADELLTNEWLTEGEVVGRTRTELKAMGQIVPPFHPRCRCGIAFVR